MERADEILPIARAEQRKLEAKLRAQEQELEGMKKTVKAVIQSHKKTADSTYESRMSQIKKDQAVAVASADTETWARLEEEKSKLAKPEEIRIEEAHPDTAGEHPAAVQWKKDNAWYTEDLELGIEADLIADRLAARKLGLAPEEFLNKVTELVKKKFPDKFKNQRRNNPPSVDRTDFSGGDDGGSNGKKTYRDLPADAKAACDDLVKQGVMKREQYVHTYFES
jgi:hypothetical protein